MIDRTRRKGTGHTKTPRRQLTPHPIAYTYTASTPNQKDFQALVSEWDRVNRLLTAKMVYDCNPGMAASVARRLLQRPAALGEGWTWTSWHEGLKSEGLAKERNHGGS